jgi:hypothetical protein
MTVIDLVPPAEGAHETFLTKAFSAAPRDAEIRLHGEWTTGRSIQAKDKFGLTIDFTDAHITQPVRVKSQFGEPILRISRSENVLLIAPRLTGCNPTALDGVKAGAEGWHGLTIGHGSKNVHVDGGWIEQTFGDLVFVGSFSGTALTGRVHNENISIANLRGNKAGRHAFTVRDCLGYAVRDTTVSAINRLWFDHEPKPYEHFYNAVLERNTGPQGGQNLWLQLLPRFLSECGNFTVRDHLLTKGNYKVAAKGGLLRERSGLTLEHLYRTPENPTVEKTVLDVRAWVDVVIQDVEGHTV